MRWQDVCRQVVNYVKSFQGCCMLLQQTCMAKGTTTPGLRRLEVLPLLPTAPLMGSARVLLYWQQLRQRLLHSQGQAQGTAQLLLGHGLQPSWLQQAWRCSWLQRLLRDAWGHRTIVL
jgi:hypothetical protein